MCIFVRVSKLGKPRLLTRKNIHTRGISLFISTHYAYILYLYHICGRLSRIKGCWLNFRFNQWPWIKFFVIFSIFRNVFSNFVSHCEKKIWKKKLWKKKNEKKNGINKIYAKVCWKKQRYTTSVYIFRVSKRGLPSLLTRKNIHTSGISLFISTYYAYILFIPYIKCLNKQFYTGFFSWQMCTFSWSGC